MYKLKHIFTFWGPDFDIASVTELKHSTKSRSSDSPLSLPSQSTPSIHQLRSSQGTCLRQVPLCGFWLAAEVHWVCYARRVVVLFFFLDNEKPTQWFTSVNIHRLHRLLISQSFRLTKGECAVTWLAASIGPSAGKPRTIISSMSKLAAVTENIFMHVLQN